MKVSEIITELNRLRWKKHGIGIIDIVENRACWKCSPVVFMTPGGTILMAAHDQLEELVLDRATYEVKKDLEINLLRSYTKENGIHHFVKQSRHLLMLHSSM